MLEDLPDRSGLGEKRDDPHRPATAGTDQRIDLVDAADELRLPGPGARGSASLGAYTAGVDGATAEQLLVAAVRDSALDAAYYHKQYERHAGHPKAHVVAILALARQRFKVKYKLTTTGAVYDKEILIASHLDRERQATHNATRAA